MASPLAGAEGYESDPAPGWVRRDLYRLRSIERCAGVNGSVAWPDAVPIAAAVLAASEGAHGIAR